MSKTKQDAFVVAAIDFGTTFSGYAFSFRHEFQQDPLRVCSSQWSTGSRVAISLKTSSTILFNRHQEFDSFGFEAEDRYSDLALDGEHKDWYYFRRFKMMLYVSAEGIHRTSTLKDDTGKEMSAMRVFSESIRYLKDHMMSAVNQRTHVQPTDVKWVLTVPAIWNDAAKSFMREAAEISGIPGSQLELALEPEAASMFCKYLPVEKVVGDSSKAITCFKPRSRYLVLDAGGGTVDITIHEVQADGTLRELFKANGGPWGGTTIDEAFLDFIAKIATQEVLDKFHEEHDDDYMDLLREFEVKKRSVQPSLENKITFKVPISLHEMYRDVHGGEIREAIRDRPELSDHLTFAGDKLRVDAETVKSLFRQTSEKIVCHIREILAMPETKGTGAILMVGGFSESPMLRAAVQTAFPDRRVIIPHEAGLAVLKGAVIFGHNDREITSRVCKYTYGIKYYKAFDPKIHPIERKIVDRHGHAEVRGAFGKLVEIGESVTLDQPCEGKSYWPSGEGNTSFVIKLYASSEKNPTFVDDKSCFKIGTVDVDCRDHCGGVGSATVMLIFGGTELRVKAIHDTTGKETTARFDFLD